MCGLGRNDAQTLYIPQLFIDSASAQYPIPSTWNVIRRASEVGLSLHEVARLSSSPAFVLGQPNWVRRQQKILKPDWPSERRATINLLAIECVTIMRYYTSSHFYLGEAEQV